MRVRGTKVGEGHPANVVDAILVDVQLEPGDRIGKGRLEKVELGSGWPWGRDVTRLSPLLLFHSALHRELGLAGPLLLMLLLWAR